MSTPSAFMTDDHRHCDELWAELEAVAAERPAAPEVAGLFRRFEEAMLRHFAFEEERLFPAFETVTGMRGGPTHVMRLEHAQMRQVLGEMGDALARGDVQGVLDHGDTLLMLAAQHNLKEEQILYPMFDARLAAQWPAMAAAWPA